MPRKPPERRCKALNKRGKPCGVPPLKGSDYCGTAGHSPELSAAVGFGSPTQAREAATGVERRYPRLRETIERKLEERAEEIVDAGLEALKATRVTVNEEGEVHVHPDFFVRLKAHETLVSRALGKPAQEQTIHADHQVLAVNIDATDPATRELLRDVLRRRPIVREPIAG